MDVITMLGALPDLRRPVLVAAFEGWNDAGEAASIALDTVSRGLEATRFAEIDAEEFFDFQQVRPLVRTEGDGSRSLVWPVNSFSWAEPPDAAHDVVLLDGTEPNLRWKTFAGGVVDLARELGVGLVVTIGALQVDVPHTRPVPLTVTTPDVRLRDELGLTTSTYEGPTGMTGLLHSVAADAGIPSISMWAGVPHYLSASPYLPGALALADRLTGILGVDLSLDRLARDAASQTDEIGELLAGDEELADYVAELEERAARAQEPAGEVPDVAISGEDIAAELERFLRDQGR